MEMKQSSCCRCSKLVNVVSNDDVGGYIGFQKISPHSYPYPSGEDAHTLTQGKVNSLRGIYSGLKSPRLDFCSRDRLSV